MATERRPTMRDVAAEAGVSFKTVSRVVNREGSVREELVTRVEAAIAKLDYRPDHRARGLRLSGAREITLGLVLVDVSNPFFSAAFRGIEEVASSRDCLVLVGSSEGSPGLEQQLIETFLGRRVDGLIVVPSGQQLRLLELEIKRGTPVVFLDLEPELDGIDLVRSDHFAGGRALTTHLLDQGHRDIAFFGDDPSVYSARLRLEGFLEATAAAGIDIPEHRVITGSHSEEQWGDIATDHFLSHPLPSAVVSAQNFVTIGTVRALHELDLHRKIAQVGFDDIELGDIVEPGLTVVSQHARNLGRKAAEMLFARLDGETGPPNQQVMPVRLITRGSGEIQPQPSAG